MRPRDPIAPRVGQVDRTLPLDSADEGFGRVARRPCRRGLAFTLVGGDDERSSSLGSGCGGARFTGPKARTRDKGALVTL
ncbi:hypothetical protein GUJ93_ZPchr0004g38392 [Zizania palustris]|uniref:Uncharacterized protein n=1 Tax=Zizania palustris TaxID=103762 RepID=A0A8J5SII8_ZIZPA|nr:hypothetical protein GUJ93_ZPchr0004g38392 [Zizania palustris]